MKPILIALTLSAAFSLQPALAQDGPTLFKSKPCSACHSIDSKLVGPALKEVAAKNAGVAGAQELLAKHIKEGTQGNWGPMRSEEHTSELQSLMRISYAVFCLKKKTTKKSKHRE